MLYRLAATLLLAGSVSAFTSSIQLAVAEDKDKTNWVYKDSHFVPLWKQQVIEQEPILFIRDPQTGIATGNLLFPVDEINLVSDSSCKTTYENGKDFIYKKGERKITLPQGSRILSVLATELRREPGSQPYRLTHRDGMGEIMFGGNLEYHNLQTWITYKPAKNDWPQESTAKKSGSLPKTAAKLKAKENVKIVLLGDSISTGCNASGWGNGAPFQPAYQDLLLQHLRKVSSEKVSLTNLSVGGMATPWGITKIPDVLSHSPDVVIIAFGMNDSGGIPVEAYKANTKTMIDAIRQGKPDAEIILVATMLGNKDWTVLKHEVFPKYRDSLAELCTEGIALADMTTIWEEMLNRKQDADLTGNGVNHPNDFGHRVYSQVLSAVLLAD